jgi:hypothetical protein
MRAAVPFLERRATTTRMELGSLSDKSGLYSFRRPDGETLFDFQIGAVAHCVSRLAQNAPAVLGLDTGLGKTCTVRAILDAMKARALVVVPGGLVRQVAAGLRRQPWEKSNVLVVAVAETGKQLASDLGPHDVLVVNRALGGTMRHRYDYDLIIIDEAHQAASMRVVYRCSYGQAKEIPVLFLTACPNEAPELADWFRPHGCRRTTAHTKAFNEACFVVEKTPRVLAALGAARPRVVEVPGAPPDLSKYAENLLRELRRSGNVGPIVRARGALYIAKAIPVSAPQAARIVQEEVREVLKRDPPVAFPRGDFVRLCEKLCTENGLTWPGPPPVSLSEELPPTDAQLRCGCCGLTDGECAVLHAAHCWAVRAHTAEEPPWSEHSRCAKGFTSALVRFPNKSSIDAALRAHPVPDGVLTFVLTADKSAAYRSRLIKKFASHDGQKVKLAILARAMHRGTAPPMLLQVGALGMGRLLLSHVEQCLARPRLLLADSTVDVGFDLHRHIDGVYMSTIVRTPAELRQITGRVSRIAVDCADQGTVDVLTRTSPGTLDELFMRHLSTTAAERGIGESYAPLLKGANRIRELLSADPQLLQLFEKLWARAGSTLV